jgi:hypothetical protein
MKTQIIFLITINFLFFLFLLFLIIRVDRKERKLLKAMDHFKPEDANTAGFIDTINFKQEYAKDVELFKALKNGKEYFTEEVVKLLAQELIKNKAVNVEFIEGEKVDTIKASIKYVVED